MKATAIAFKPGGYVKEHDSHNANVEGEDEEGRKIWVGTNSGDLQEIDVSTKTVVVNRREAHGTATITKIHRCISDLLTVDDDGKVLIWPAEPDTGTPMLDSSPYIAKILPKSTFSIMVGTQLWVTLGKGIWVYEYDRRQHTLTQMTKHPLVQLGAGDITCGTTVATGGRPADRIYFGHGGVDGKISIYSREDGYQCIGVVPVSLYPIRALAGVGDRLWAGFKTGKIYIYDINTHPWKVVKDWKAHDDSIQAMQLDHHTVWRRSGRKMPVASMGKDGMVKFWDGLLTDDWVGMCWNSAVSYQANNYSH
jgi:WD40 repeat protein